MGQLSLIKASHITPFMQSMNALGLPVSSILQRCSLDEDWFDNPNQLIPERKAWAMLESPKIKEGIDDFGFYASSQNSLSDYGEFGDALLSSETIYEAIKTFIHEMPAQTTARPFWTERCDNYLWFCREGIKGATKGAEQVEQHVLSLMVQTVRLGAGSLWSPPKIHIQSSILADETHSSFVTHSQVLANQPRTAIAIPIELLLLPIAKRQNVVPAARTTSAEISTVLTDVIMDMIRLNFSPCRFNMSTISSQLDLHPRRLQRLLKSERTSFRKIVGTIRLNEAKELLQHTELTVTEIALHLGYSDQANFWRAFVNATGLSPSEFRYQVSLETLT